MAAFAGASVYRIRIQDGVTPAERISASVSTAACCDAVSGDVGTAIVFSSIRFDKNRASCLDECDHGFPVFRRRVDNSRAGKSSRCSNDPGANLQCPSDVRCSRARWEQSPSLRVKDLRWRSLRGTVRALKATIR